MAALTRLAPLAEAQWGLITSAQARAIGVSAQVLAQLARNGEAERVAHGVYRLAGAPDHEFERVRTAWLRLDPARSLEQRQQDSPPDVISRRTAARVLGLGDLDADLIQITVPVRRQTREPDVRLIRRDLTAGDWELVDGLPVTTAAKTAADLAEAGTDGGHLAGVVRDALDAGLADEPGLSAAIAPSAHRYGARAGDGPGALRKLLTEAGRPPLPDFESQAAHIAARIGTVATRAAVDGVRENLAQMLAPFLAQQQQALGALDASALRDALNAPALKAAIGTSALRDALNAPVLQAAAAPASRRALESFASRRAPVPTAHGDELSSLLASPEMATAAAEHPVVARLIELIHDNEEGRNP